MRKALLVALTLAATLSHADQVVINGFNGPFRNVTLFDDSNNVRAMGGFFYPFDGAISPAGEIYYTPDSQYIYKFSVDGSNGSVFADLGSGHAGRGIAFDSIGNLYAADYNGGGVVRFNRFGTRTGFFPCPAGAIAVAVKNNKLWVVCFDSQIVRTFDLGTGAFLDHVTGFRSPYGIAVAGDDTWYVSSYFDNFVRKFTNNGFTTFDYGGFSFPIGLEIGPNGAIFVGDTGHDRIARIATDGTVSTYLSLPGQHSGAIRFGKVKRFLSKIGH